MDAAGNVESTHTVTIPIDTVAPTTTDQLAGTLGNSNWYTTAVNVTLTAIDATSGVAATYYMIDGGSRLTYTGSTFTVSAQGSHTISFWSVDAAGKVETAGTDSFKIDTIKPATTDTLSGTRLKTAGTSARPST